MQGTVLCELLEDAEGDAVELLNVGDRMLLASGGRGGLGNRYFKRGKRSTTRLFTKGDAG